VLNEDVLADKIGLPINAENFSTLIASNFLLAMDARDHRLTRDEFENVLVLSFNFQNRMVRISEIAMLLEKLAAGEGFGTTDLTLEMTRHMAQAQIHQIELQKTLALFQEMRRPEDPVS